MKFHVLQYLENTRMYMVIDSIKEIGRRGVTEILRTSPITSSNSNNPESEKSYGLRFSKLEWRSSCQVGDRIGDRNNKKNKEGDLHVCKIF